jgi:hypothetical protein
MAPLLFLAAACDDEQHSVYGSTGFGGECATNQVQIAVNDGFIQNLCGCSEPAATIFPPATLTCTVDAGTVVYFWYLGTTLRHQIHSSASPTFPTSPVSDPNNSNPIKVHVVTLNTAGTYDFEDIFEPSLSGSIIVQ